VFSGVLTDAARLLETHGTDPTQKRKDNATPIQIALAIGNATLLETIFSAFKESRGKAVNLDASGFTVLHEAIKDGNVEVVKCLVAAGAKLTSFSRQEFLSPVQLATQLGRNESAFFDSLVCISFCTFPNAEWNITVSLSSRQERARFLPKQVPHLFRCQWAVPSAKALNASA